MKMLMKKTAPPAIIPALVPGRIRIKSRISCGVFLIFVLAVILGGCPLPVNPPNVKERRNYSIAIEGYKSKTGYSYQNVFPEGSYTTPPAPLLFELKNNGNKELENIGLVLKGDGAEDFELVDEADRSIGMLTLAPGENRKIKVVFPNGEPKEKLYTIDFLASWRHEDQVTGVKETIRYGAYTLNPHLSLAIMKNGVKEGAESGNNILLEKKDGVYFVESPAQMSGMAWFSTNPNIAEIDPITGKLTLNSPGSTWIGITYKIYDKFQLYGKKLTVWEDPSTLVPEIIVLKPGINEGDIAYTYSTPPTTGSWMLYIAKGAKDQNYDFTNGAFISAALDAGKTNDAVITGLTAGAVYSARIVENGGSLLRKTPVVWTVAQTAVNAFFLRFDGSLNNELQMPKTVRNLYAPASGNNIAVTTGANTIFQTGLRSGEKAIRLNRQQFLQLDNRTSTAAAAIVNYQAAQAFDYNNSFTIAFWIRLRSIMSAAVDPPIFSNKPLGIDSYNYGPWTVGNANSATPNKGNGGFRKGFVFYYKKTDGTIRLHAADGTSRLSNNLEDFTIINAPIPQNPDTADNWIHIAAVFNKNSGTVKYYANGSPINTQTINLSDIDISSDTEAAAAIIGNAVRGPGTGQMYNGYQGGSTIPTIPANNDLDFLIQDFLLIPDVLDDSDIAVLGTR